MQISKPRIGRRPKRYSQAERLSRMVRTLASRASTMKDLAQEFDITRRQAYRDLQRIEEEGHPLTHTEEPGERLWQLPLGYRGLPPLTISPYELMSLQLARAELAHLDGTPFVEDLDHTLAKFRASLPAKTINHYDRILQVFAPLPKPIRSYGHKNAVLRDLRKALLLQLTIEVDYRKPGRQTPQCYRVDPYALVLYQRGLYLAGWSQAVDEERTFAVTRMEQIRLTDDRFELPDRYSVQTRFGSLFGLMEERPQKVVLNVQADIAHVFRECQWHPTQRVKPLQGGGVAVSFTAGGLEEIAWWVLSYGERVKVMAPPDLVRLVTEKLANALQRYP
jgi:predicted DNA-binding transcriptional regulator YafY